MRVAAIYDIHGNLPALEAVLAEILEEGVDQIVVGGDVVPGPLAGESLATLLELPVPLRCLHGNGESAVLTAHRGEEPTQVPPPVREAIRWIAAELSSEQLAELERWPPTQRLAIPRLGEVLFCHATPRNDTELFTRRTPEERLLPVFEPTGADLVVCGHTHMPFDRRVGAVRVINAGSVGMPFGEPGADWLLLGPGLVEPRHTTYDLEAASRRIRATAYPGAAEFEVVNPRPAAEMEELFEAAALR